MELLYEASNFQIQLRWVLPFAILGFAGLIALYKGKIFVKFLGIVALIICAHTLFSFCYGYVTIIEAYEHGNYQTVRGRVENFQPASQGGETTEDEELESFNIRRVHFEYGDSLIEKFGYHKPSANGGVIKENGQRLQIGYVPTEQGNVIVKIEQVTED